MTRKGVWGLQGVRDKYLRSLWEDSYNAFGWGHNEEGEAGTSPWNKDQSSPTVLQETSGVALAKMGTCGTGGILIASSGQLRSWGKNQYGQLGQNQNGPGNTNSLSSPTQIGSGTKWVQGFGGSAGLLNPNA